MYSSLDVSFSAVLAYKLIPLLSYSVAGFPFFYAFLPQALPIVKLMGIIK